MKRFIKNNLKVFVAVVISGIVFTGIGVYAANTYLAHDISYTPSNENFEVSNVEDALNELYEASNPKMTKGILKTGNVSSDTYSEFAKYILDKGNYLIYTSFSTIEGSVGTEIKGCNSSKIISTDTISNWDAVDWQHGRGNVTTQWFECKIEEDNTEITIRNKKDQYSNPYVVKAFVNYFKID